LNQVLQNLPFACLSLFTTKHCDQYMVTVALIIDFLICLEACCQVTLTNEYLISTLPHSCPPY